MNRSVRHAPAPFTCNS